MDLIHEKHDNINHLKKLLLQHDDMMHLIIIRVVPNSWVLKLMTRALILSVIMLSLPWINVVMEDLMSSKVGSSDFPVRLVPALYKEFANEGFLKTGDKVLILSNGNREDDTSGIDIEMMSPNDVMKSQISSGAYDLVLVYDFPSSSSLINRILKPLGIVVVLLRDDNNTSRPTTLFQKPVNYKIVYLRRKSGSTVMAMRKMYQVPTNLRGRRLLGFATESKKAALSHLEDVLLEPPRAASVKSTRYLKKTKYLPDLMIGDSLSSYPRRIFIDVNLVDKNNNNTSSRHDDDDEIWFSKHYPTRNTKFDMYKVDAIGGSSSSVPQIGMSDWLRANVKENEYVVMKAEAEVVEEMMETKAIRLVDELFLECKHRGIKKSESRRAYWECLALYGRLRDEGIAVHQWWG